MNLRFSKAALACAAGLAVLATLGLAQIERLDLSQMVAKTDDAVVGKIVQSRVVRTDNPVPELYFTTLTIEGKSLYRDQPLTVEVTFAGGFLTPTEGVFNSEAPSADDIKIGNRIVAFFKHSENMGNGVTGNALYAAHGGLYRVFSSPQGPVVLGRGNGYALSRNWTLASLDEETTRLAGLKR
jgi:hypothetical protein